MVHPRPRLVPLNMTRIEIFLQIREKGFLKEPMAMRTLLEQRDRLKYYSFHRD